MVVLSMDNTQIYPASCPYICEIQLSLRTYFTILRTNYCTYHPGRGLGFLWSVETSCTSGIPLYRRVCCNILVGVGGEGNWRTWHGETLIGVIAFALECYPHHDILNCTYTLTPTQSDYSLKNLLFLTATTATGVPGDILVLSKHDQTGVVLSIVSVQDLFGWVEISGHGEMGRLHQRYPVDSRPSDGGEIVLGGGVGEEGRLRPPLSSEKIGGVGGRGVTR